MSMILTRTALQTLHGTITGVTSAPTTYPASLSTAQLPIVLVWPGRGEWRQDTFGYSRSQIREYIVRCFFLPIPQGSPDKPPAGAETLLQRFGETYLDPAKAVLDAGGYQVTILGGEGDIRDSGLGIIKYAGVDYHAFEFRIRASERQ